MGRIKTLMIKNTAKTLQSEMPETFTEDYEHNKKALGNSMPSKKTRNKIAGYLGRLVKQQKAEKSKPAREYIQEDSE